MKMSELIKALEAMKENFGDLPVYHMDDEALFELSSVKYKPGEKSGSDCFPERIELDE